MRPLIVFLLALLCAACTPTHGSQTPHTSASADLERKTVAFVQREKPYCSGVWIADDEIITANHCVDDLEIGEPVAYVTRGDVAADQDDELEAVHRGRLGARDEAHDLALIVVKLPPAHGIASLATDAAYVGQPVQTMGHPLGLWWSYSTGFVSAVRRLDLNDEDMWWIQSTAPISPGNSGGGLFNASGDLMGVCDAYFPRGENLNVYVPTQYVSAFLDAASKQ